MNKNIIVDVEIVENHVKYYDENFNLLCCHDVLKITTYFKYLNKILNVFKNLNTSYYLKNEFEIVEIEIDENVDINELFVVLNDI